MTDTLTVDLGGTRVKMARWHDEVLVASSTIPAPVHYDLDEALSQVAAFARESSHRPVERVGIAIPGLVDRATRQLRDVNAKWTAAIGFDFTSWAASTFTAPCLLENDALAALIGEVTDGAAQGRRNVVMITLGTGIGAVAMVDGIPLRGALGYACLGGHMTVNIHGQVCSCGNTGCAEAEASTATITERAQQHPLFSTSALAGVPRIDFAVIVELADQDELAAHLYQHAITVWGALIVNHIHVLDPECVVVGGGIAAAGDAVLRPLQAYVDTHVWRPGAPVPLLASTLGDAAALAGMRHICQAG